MGRSRACDERGKAGSADGWGGLRAGDKGLGGGRVREGRERIGKTSGRLI